MYDPGDIVEISGIKSKPHWNGKKAKITDTFNWEKGRYPICILINDQSSNDEKALLKPSNIKLVTSNDDEKDDNGQYFELIKTKDKGIGMFAACDIKSGTIILNDKPLLSLSRNNNDNDNESIINQFKELSKENKEKISGYHNQIDSNDSDILGLYFTNAFSIINDESEIKSGFFPNIARMNHSCLSNCEVLSSDINTKSRSIIALFDIKKGEELTINYIGNSYYTLSMAQKVRKQYILSNYNFDCKCIHCTNYDKKMENFRKQYGKYQDIIDENVNNFNKKAFKAVLSASHEMINIIKEGFNGYPTILSQIYINSAHALLFLNEHEKSLNYLKRSVEIDQKYYGNKAVFDDVEECLAKIPNKYSAKYPWHHVLNLE